MSFTRLVSTYKDAPGGPVTTDPIDTTGADLIAAFVAWGLGDDLTVSDNKVGNIWTKGTIRKGPSTGYVRIYFTKPIAVGANHMFNCSDVFFNFPSISVIAYKGSKATNFFDAETGTANGGTQPGQITPVGADLFLTVYQNGAGSTIDSGFSVVIAAGATRPMAVAELIETTAAAQNPTWAGNGPQAIAMAAFIGAAVTSIKHARFPSLGHRTRGRGELVRW